MYNCFLLGMYWWQWHSVPVMDAGHYTTIGQGNEYVPQFQTPK